MAVGAGSGDTRMRNTGMLIKALLVLLVRERERERERMRMGG